MIHSIKICIDNQCQCRTRLGVFLWYLQEFGYFVAYLGLVLAWKVCRLHGSKLSNGASSIECIIGAYLRIGWLIHWFIAWLIDWLIDWLTKLSCQIVLMHKLVIIAASVHCCDSQYIKWIIIITVLCHIINIKKPAYNVRRRDWSILAVIEGGHSVQVRYEKGQFFADVIFVSDN